MRIGTLLLLALALSCSPYPGAAPNPPSGPATGLDGIPLSATPGPSVPAVPPERDAPFSAASCPGTWCSGNECCPAGFVCVEGNGCIDPRFTPVTCTDAGVACAGGCCPTGARCLDDAGCTVAATPVECPASAPVICPARLGCCPTAGACAGGGGCIEACSSPTGTSCWQVSVGDDGGSEPLACCPDVASCLPDHDGCAVPFSPALLPAGTGPAGGASDGGSVDDGGSAAITTPEPATCAGASCDGDLCCPEGSVCSNDSCVVCGLDVPTPCNGMCCPAETACLGSQCGSCPADHPQACGDSCCLADAFCVSGCSCPRSAPVPCAAPDASMANCCPAGSTCGPGGECLSCADGGHLCTGDPDAGTVAFCCPEGESCTLSGCCPRGLPEFCGQVCCPFGAECLSGGKCFSPILF
jgi:hypothetical protein